MTHSTWTPGTRAPHVAAVGVGAREDLEWSRWTARSLSRFLHAPARLSAERANAGLGARGPASPQRCSLSLSCGSRSSLTTRAAHPRQRALRGRFYRPSLMRWSRLRGSSFLCTLRKEEVHDRVLRRAHASHRAHAPAPQQAQSEEQRRRTTEPAGLLHTHVMCTHRPPSSSRANTTAVGFVPAPVCWSQTAGAFGAPSVIGLANQTAVGTRCKSRWSPPTSLLNTVPIEHLTGPFLCCHRARPLHGEAPREHQSAPRREQSRAPHRG